MNMEVLMKSRVVNLLVVAFVGVWGMFGAEVHAAEVVYFEDANLKAAVEAELRVTDPTNEDMSRLSTLHAGGHGITSLVGLEDAVNVTELWLHDNQISDISPLSGLRKLMVLDLYSNEISDISPLVELMNLTELGVGKNDISDISLFARLTNLRGLGLNNNQISDISPLAELTNLGGLNLYDNQISDISPLAELSNLTDLYLDSNQINDITPLGELTNLRSVSLRSNQISDMSALGRLTNLRVLSLESNQISDLSILVGFTNIEYLYLGKNPISDISPLAELTNLEGVSLRSNSIIDINPLAGLTNLEVLDLRDMQISDLSPLAGLTNLRQFLLDSNQISDLGPLAGMTNLKVLSLYSNPLSVYSEVFVLGRVFEGEDDVRVYYEMTPIIFHPLPGENVIAGNNYKLSWADFYDRTGRRLESVVIEYSDDYGLSWFEVGVVANTGKYLWRVPEKAGGGYLLRISDAVDGVPSYTSSHAFGVVECDIAGDVTGDCVVNLEDLATLAGNWLGAGRVEFAGFGLESEISYWQVEGEWEFGVPVGGGGMYGFGDPASGYTGGNVYGVNLYGDVSVEAGGPYSLTAGPFDCGGYEDVTLSFARWLNTDVPDYTYTAIEVSSDGVNWNLLWENSGEVTDDGWRLVEYDISEYADGQRGVYIRWSYAVYEQAYSYSGWNIDDVVLTGMGR